MKNMAMHMCATTTARTCDISKDDEISIEL